MLLGIWAHVQKSRARSLPEKGKLKINPVGQCGWHICGGSGEYVFKAMKGREVVGDIFLLYWWMGYRWRERTMTYFKQCNQQYIFNCYFTSLRARGVKFNFQGSIIVHRAFDLETQLPSECTVLPLVIFVRDSDRGWECRYGGWDKDKFHKCL